MQKTKLLVIGPSIKKSKGGMASVIRQEAESPYLNEKLQMKIFSSYCDGKPWKRMLYSGWKILCGLAAVPAADTLHIHMTSKGSMIRKLFYIQEGLLFHKKIIVQIHCCEYFLEKLYEMPAWVQKRARKLLSKTDSVLCLSHKFKKMLEDELGLTNCLYFPNGIAPENYEFSEHKEGNVVGYLGKIRTDKGVPDLLKAVSILQGKDITVSCIIGGTGDLPAMKKLCEEYKLENVIFPGWMTEKDKKELLSMSRVLALPSYHEGFPVVILEAMASGVEVVATDVGAIPEVIETDLKPGDIQGLANMIAQKLLTNKDQLEQNRRKTEEEYNIHTLHKKLYLILKADH